LQKGGDLRAPRPAPQQAGQLPGTRQLAWEPVPSHGGPWAVGRGAVTPEARRASSLCVWSSQDMVWDCHSRGQQGTSPRRDDVVRAGPVLPGSPSCASQVPVSVASPPGGHQACRVAFVLHRPAGQPEGGCWGSLDRERGLHVLLLWPKFTAFVFRSKHTLGLCFGCT
jgi:hypothetical protein